MTLPANITLQGFKDFVRSKYGPFDYKDNQNCAFAQYLKSLGYKNYSVGSNDFRIERGGKYFEMSALHKKLAYVLVYNEDFQNLSKELEELL